MTPLGVYVHVPFCAKKCPYCDFYSVQYGKDKVTAYVSSVIRNINNDTRIPDKTAYCVDSVYFGGGTPSLLDGTQIKAVLDAVRSAYNVSDSCEITTECNPCSFSGANISRLNDFREAGVNRLSIGVQSLDDNELSYLGRLHNASMAENVINQARSCGFDNISADLMLALPTQTNDSIKRSVCLLRELNVKHISAYMLKIEEGTPFYARNEENVIPDEDDSAQMYLYTVNLLKDAGYSQYEISNFCIDGYECIHNLKYWHNTPFVAYGPSGASMLGSIRTLSSPDLDSFICEPLQNLTVTDTEADSEYESFMLNIRLTKSGVRLDDYSFLNGKERTLDAMRSAGLINIDNNILTLTPRGCLVSNSIITALSG